MTKSKKIILWAVLCSVGVHLLEFLLYFIPYYVIEADGSATALEIYEYVRTFLTRFFDFGVAIVAAAVICLRSASQTVGKTILGGLYIALGKLTYLLPYYYLFFIQISGGSDSGEALAMSALASAFDTVVFWGNILLFCLVIRLVAKHFCYRKMLNEIPQQRREKLTERNKRDLMESAKSEAFNISGLNAAFDFSNALTVGLFAPALIKFILNFISETITAIDYLKSYAGYYQANEIVYMMISFLSILVYMLLTHDITFKTIAAFKAKETTIE